jgi:hypothetical protein
MAYELTHKDPYRALFRQHYERLMRGDTLYRGYATPQPAAIIQPEKETGLVAKLKRILSGNNGTCKGENINNRTN